MKEPDYEEMLRGRVKYLPPRFMSVNVAVEQLLEVADRLQGNVLRCVVWCWVWVGVREGMCAM